MIALIAGHDRRMSEIYQSPNNKQFYFRLKPRKNAASESSFQLKEAKNGNISTLKMGVMGSQDDLG